MQRVPMTPRGFEILSRELKHQKEHVRMSIVRDIEEARAHGDISENSEFEDAKHRQALCDGRIRELESKCAAAEIIDVAKITPSERVIFGATVEVEDLDTEKTFVYKIVGTDEADVKAGLISVTAPLGRAMVGRELGDEVSFDTPRGVRRFAITDVMYK